MLEDKRLIWGKIALKSYKLIPDWISCMKSARATLVMSGVGRFNYFRGMTNEELYDKLILLNYRMQGIVNLKVLTELAIDRLAEPYRSVMSEIHLSKVSIADYASRHFITKRTVYNYLKRGFRLFCAELCNMGYTPEKFEMEYKEEPLLELVKKRLNNKNNQSSKSSKS